MERKGMMSLWAGIIMLSMLVGVSGYFVGTLGAKADLKSTQDTLERITVNRDHYRTNSIQCSFAFESLKNFVLNEDFDAEDLGKARKNIERFDRECQLDPVSQ